MEEESSKLGVRLDKALARARRAVGDEAATRAKCAAEVARLEAKVPLLEARAEKAESELAALRSEVAIVRDREAEAARSQKDLLLAFLEKVLFSSHFGDVSAGLAEVMNASAVAEAMKEVAAAFPDLDLSRFRREEPSAEEVLQRYAQVMAKFVRALPVVKAMLESPTLWTAESVRDCSVDLDIGLEAVLAELGYFKQALGAEGSEAGETGVLEDSAGTDVLMEATEAEAPDEAAGDVGEENAGASV